MLDPLCSVENIFSRISPTSGNGFAKFQKGLQQSKHKFPTSAVKTKK
jgi:hypothetical protein